MGTFNTKLVTVQEDDTTQELFIEIPPYFLEQLGWNEGTEIEWHIDENSIKITKVKDTTVSQEEPRETNNNAYVEETAKETFGEQYYSPEAQGHW